MTGPSLTTDPLAAAAHLRAGGVVAFPTETVYGLGVDALNVDAVRALYALKGRPDDKPLPVLVDGWETARGLVREAPDRAKRLASRYWPGPLTLVLPRLLEGERVLPSDVTAGLDSVGLRCPDHGLTVSMLRAFGGPAAGPSANPSGSAPATCVDEVLSYFADAGGLLILDGGACREGVASTVVRVTASGVEVLRAGAVDVGLPGAE